ncbi:triacylglycerol lipase [Thermosyntropha lipolytica DSM 11003]|uniref:triacylglycerol lipase n=1 Tax=Thermosyntropha lipolytica DSM 11003 TaxID=1123382 RepID=A0A1M5JMV7_9FIRM|nr:hypothetical protein [Thermosyntropha lipolytica]SHG41589.1 triacylglycerol lipase [Thermosyntropha lipolytica DSM 11003]
MGKILKHRYLSLFILLIVFLELMGFPQFVYASQNCNSSGNKYPIVLVHGLGGFGRDELGGVIKYWGGVYDIQEYLKSRGYEVYTVSIGPVSSNWDRACELYAQLVGGTVDYGAAHAAKYGHKRYGRTYPGLIPDLGKIDPKTGEMKKVHLIGHSMGGQTIRTLVQLLAEGCEEERNYSQENVSPLFMGGNNWVKSVTTISTPHDGTSLADYYYNDPKSVTWRQHLIGLIASTPLSDNSNLKYDLKLDQWGLTYKKEESTYEYLKRIINSSFWMTNRDLANYDVSIEGAAELNSWVKAQPDVYYFSWATQATTKSRFSDYQVPIWSMYLEGWQSAYFMGSYTRNIPGKIPVTSEWWPNDGAVNVISQNGPKINSNDRIINFDGNPVPGVWNFMGIMDTFDHRDIIGLGTYWNPCPWYLKHVELLAKLPTDYISIPKDIEEDIILDRDCMPDNEIGEFINDDNNYVDNHNSSLDDTTSDEITEKMREVNDRESSVDREVYNDSNDINPGLSEPGENKDYESDCAR